MAKSLSLFAGKKVLILFVALYAVGAVLAARKVITHTTDSTTAIEDILKTYNMRNEGEQVLESFKKAHPFLGLFASPVKKELKLPSRAKSNEALGPEVKELLKKVRRESSIAAWWSWFLLSLSLFYVVAVVALERRLATRAVLFTLTTVSVVFFLIGIFAPAMVIWTAPNIPMASGTLNFVVQHQVRGIAAIIWELLTGGHWMIGGFLLLFSIITPLTKATLTFFVTVSPSKEVNFKIGQLLHTIGKWSMADVFVAAILLALYALKFQEATKSIPCLGLYYFIGYCLLSLSTTEVLVNSGVVAGNEDKEARRRNMGTGMVAGLVAAMFCFVAASSLYTYDQYSKNLDEKVTARTLPSKLDNADLVLPGHK